jgi:putative DNA methylase
MSATPEVDQPEGELGHRESGDPMPTDQRLIEDYILIEAIVFAYPQHVELDGPRGLKSGSNPLMEKRRGKYRVRDFAERGADTDLGLSSGREMAPLVDVVHHLLWLVEHRPALIPAYLDKVQPDFEQLRLVAHALAGPTLAGNGEGGARPPAVAKGAEASALRKLTTNWRTLVEAHRGALV